jgi:hypothetical protein
VKIIKYGPGGRDPSKPNNNIREEREVPDLPDLPEQRKAPSPKPAGTGLAEPPAKDESD